MASILFNHRFPSLTLSASTPVISEQKKSNDLLILDPQQEVIFERKINASYIFESRDKSISFPLNLHAFLKQLVIDLEVGGIEIERLPLVGSQMVDVLLENERPHNDIDFLVLIRKGKNLSQIRAIFLKLLFKFSGIETENLSDGKVLCILKDQRILKVDKAEDVFAQGALDALGMYGNIMPITIPLIGFKIDITFAWDLDSSCLLSSNCFQGDLLPFLKGMGGLNTVMAADGYDAQRSLNLLISGFFYVLPGHPSKLRDGLRGYIHAITSGIFPGDYGIEKEFLEKWLQEYPTVDRKIIFLSNLIKHFEKHYRTEPFSTSAYLINLRTFFASKEFEEKDAWLISFDMFVWPQVGTPKILETILFWHFSENPIKCRLDCVTNSSPTRFRVLLPFGALLIEAPWVESLSLLTSKKPSTIPSYFQNLFSENTILSRLALIQTPEVPLAKLLTYLVKLNLKQFIQEFACNLKYIQPNQINQLEQLFFKLMPKSAFQLKANALEFLKFASKAGHLAHAKAALGKIVIPTNLSVDENDIVFSIATDIESWKSLAKRAPNILIAHLLNLPPSKELFDQIAALSLPKVAWKNNWVDFIGQNPNLFEQFLNLSCFKSLHMEVAQKLLQSLEKSRVAWEFLFEQQPSQLPPSLELLTKVKTFPVKQWPSSWIDFIEQNPTLLERFVQTPTFGSGFHIKATDRLLKVSDFFHMAWQIGCANGSILEEHKEILTRMKKASPQEITSFTNGLLQLFEANDVLALKWSRIFFKTAPFSVLEKNLSSIPNCWRLLQLATKQTIRSSPLLIKEQLNYLKTVLKSEDDLLILVSNLIKNDSLTVYHRTELVSDLFVFMRFLQPQQQIAGKATFVQNFFTLIITLFEDPLFMEKRKRIVDLLSSFSGNVIQLPLFLKSIDKPFNECLAPLAADLQHSDEMLRYFVHWLVLAQHSNNEAKTILESLSKTLTKEQVFPADAIMIMEAFDQLSDQLVEQALSREPNPKLLLSFLESQKVTSPFLKQFEMLALTIKDWNFAIRLALQIKRLGCKDLIPEILSNKVLFTSEHLPLLQEVVFDGIHAELVWKTALPSFTDRNVHFQLQLASF